MAHVADDTEALAAVIASIADGLPAALAGRAIAERLRASALSPTPASVAACAQWLARLGYIGQAENVFGALKRLYPAMPAGLAGLAGIAMQRREWNAALRRWDEVLAAFPTQRHGYWRAARARALYELGRDDEAAAILQTLVTDFAEQPHGCIGLAQMAMRRRLWSDALQRWDEVLARYPQHDGLAFSRTARANVLAMLGRHAEAEAMLRALIQADPWMIDAYAVLMRVLAATGKYAEAAQTLQDSIFSDAAIPALCRPQLQILLQWRLLDEARALFERNLQNAADPDSIDALLAAAPMLFEGWRRTQIWLEMLQRLDDCQMRLGPEGLRACHTLRARIKLALKDHHGFLQDVRIIDAPEHLGELDRSIQAVAAVIADPRFPDYSKPKVFGIGLSKTGTSSLAAALTRLGMSALHWTNPLTGEVIGDDDLCLFDAFTDVPVCMAFEKYYYMFPASKFIYTLRPFESWIGSMRRQRERMLNIDQSGEFRRQLQAANTFRYGTAFCGIHQTLYLNHLNFRAAFDAYDRRVRGFFSDKPKDRFLTFSVFAGDGWPELCGFLGTPLLPTGPFPFENRSPPIPADLKA
jgi:tetratricopeptide (TPR) repeat protein